jgi:hypothetical protein
LLFARNTAEIASRANFWEKTARMIFISQSEWGEAEGNRSGRGVPESCQLPQWYTLTVLLYRNRNNDKPKLNVCLHHDINF